MNKNLINSKKLALMFHIIKKHWFSIEQLHSHIYTI